MTRRERLERRLERREEWASSRSAKASASQNRAHSMLDGIPPGQPVLIGHHSEKRHRSTLRKADAAMFQAIEHDDMAAHHAGKARGIERQLATSIFSDDDDALEQLRAKLAGLEAKRKRMRDANRLYRKGDAEGLAKLGFPDLEKLRAEIATRYTWEQKGPFRPYELSNLGGQIGQVRKRIADVEAMQARAAKAEQAGGVVIEGGPDAADWVRVTFAEKPARDVLQELKAAGFRWGAGSWCGPRGGLPASVVAGEV